MRLNLFCKQISLNLGIFGRIQGDLKEKRLCFSRNYARHLWILDSSCQSTLKFSFSINCTAS